MKLNWKRILLIIGTFIVSAVLHNVVYAITGIEEAFFFIIAVIVIPLYFIVSLIYTLGKFLLKKIHN